MKQNETLLLEYINAVSHKLNDQDNISSKIADAVYDTLYYVGKNSTYTDSATVLVFTDGHLKETYGKIK